MWRKLASKYSSTTFNGGIACFWIRFFHHENNTIDGVLCDMGHYMQSELKRKTNIKEVDDILRPLLVEMVDWYKIIARSWAQDQTSIKHFILEREKQTSSPAFWMIKICFENQSYDLFGVRLLRGMESVEFKLPVDHAVVEFQRALRSRLVRRLNKRK